MPIQLTPETEALIREKVDSGRYATADEVIEVALRLLAVREQHTQQLRASIAEGLAAIERGEGVELTPELMDEIDREIDERLRRGERPNPDVCP